MGLLNNFKIMLKKFAVIIILFFTLFEAVPVLAVDASSQIPGMNPFCWKRKDCWQVRSYYLSGIGSLTAPSEQDKKKLDEGFVSNSSAAPCTGGEGENQWGRCLPAGVTKTEINFGGKSEFSNVGDFILLMYKWLVTVASILSVIMIIVAGVQWITSGGNSESISSAKSRISGAVIGLFIAYMSYFILNTINPNLVNFRLPQVWLVRPQNLLPQFCKDLPGADDGKIKFFYYAESNDQNSEVNLSNKKPDYSLTYNNFGVDSNNLFTFGCGRRFLAEESGTQTCFGDACNSTRGNRYMCIGNWDKDSNLSCQKGELFIHYFLDDSYDIDAQLTALAAKLNKNLIISKAVQTDWMFPDQRFWGVCDAGKIIYLNADKAKKFPMRYYLANNGESKLWEDDSDKAYVPFKKKNGTSYEYGVAHSKLADWEDQGWACNEGGEFVGYLMRVETASDQSTWSDFKDVITLDSGKGYKPNLSVGYNSSTGKAVFGTMSEDVGSSINDFSNYIPVSKLRDGGLRLEVGVTIGKFKRMFEKSAQNPGSFNKYCLGESDFSCIFSNF